MKILYDGEIFIRQKVGGINRYFSNLISWLPHNYEPIITTLNTCESSLPDHANLKLLSYNRFGIKPGRLSYAVEPYYFEMIEKFSSYQIFHPTYHYLLTRKKLTKRNKPIVITVYDLLQELFPSFFDSEEVHFKKAAILAADVIICISENTKKDLIDYYKISEEKIFVTYLAANLNASLTSCMASQISIPKSPYILYVGSRHKHKNFNVLLDSFGVLVKCIDDIKLCVVSHPFQEQELKIIADKGLQSHIKNISYVNDSDLVKLYQNCLCFVYPSIYEGFGIPLLEAMLCKAPVIASCTSSIPEIVGEAGLLFDPMATNELTDRLLFLFNNPAARQSLIAKGIHQASKFSWNKTVNQTLKIYRSLV